MNDRPSAEELLEAVERFLRDEVVPALDGHLKFQARVAANVVGIVSRETASQDDHLDGEWARLQALLGEGDETPRGRDALRDGIRARTEALVQRIRAGDADEGEFRERVVAHLRQTVADKLVVSKPRV